MGKSTDKNDRGGLGDNSQSAGAAASPQAGTPLPQSGEAASILPGVLA